MEKTVKVVIIFYITTYVLIYGLNFLVSSSLLSIEPGPVFLVLVNSSIILFYFVLIFFLSKLFLYKPVQVVLGLRREGTFRSLLWSGAIGTPIVVLLLFGVFVIGPEEVLKFAKPGWVNSQPYPVWLPLAALIFWSLSGIASFSLFQAFPYECLSEKPKKYVLPAIMVLWACLYNVPFLTGKWDPVDILFFGVIFTLIYHRTRNAVGLILNYVLVFEAPVLWTFWAAWGLIAFWIFLYIRVTWCFTCLVVLMYVRK